MTTLSTATFGLTVQGARVHAVWERYGTVLGRGWLGTVPALALQEEGLSTHLRPPYVDDGSTGLGLGVQVHGQSRAEATQRSRLL